MESHSDNHQAYMKFYSWLSSLFLLHAGHAALHFFRRYIFKMHRYSPFVSPGIFNSAGAIAIKLVGHGLFDGCALSDGALHGLIDIVNVEEEPDWRIAQRL